MAYSNQGASWDKATHALNTIEYEHHEIHSGSSYFYADGITLADTGVQQYMITAPNTTKWAHLVTTINMGLAGTVTIHEAGDRAGDAAATVFNRDRNSANTAGVAVHKGITGGNTDGTLLYTGTFGSTGTPAGKGAVGGGARGISELILKQNTKYLYTITSAAADNGVAVEFDWYEHTNKVG